MAFKKSGGRFLEDFRPPISEGRSIRFRSNIFISHGRTPVEYLGFNGAGTDHYGHVILCEGLQRENLTIGLWPIRVSPGRKQIYQVLSVFVCLVSGRERNELATDPPRLNILDSTPDGIQTATSFHGASGAGMEEHRPLARISRMAGDIFPCGFWQGKTSQPGRAERDLVDKACPVKPA